jgi:aryl-alcohol dehydrogenase-like predicted oxidoreductase
MPHSRALNSYFTLGRTGLRVSRLALGTMTFGTDWGWGTDKETARELVNTYVDAGGNFFDTADLYTNGTSETWLGEFIAERGLRDAAVISTKFSYNAQPGNPNAGGNGRKNILRAVEASLKRLGTDYIDLYMLHTWDRVTSAEEVMRSLDDLVRSGKVRYVGLSDVPAWYASRAQTIAEFRGYEPLAALQLEYSLAQRSIEHEFVPLGSEHGMGIMAWAPLANGLLSGKYRAGRDSDAGASRLEVLKGSNHPALTTFSARNLAIVAELEAVAKQLSRGMAEVALNWVANRPGVASAIVGATKLTQLAQNIAALSFEIPSELQDRLDAVSAPERGFPYTLFGDEVQGMLHGGATVGAKRHGYVPDVLISASGATVAA